MLADSSYLLLQVGLRTDVMPATSPQIQGDVVHGGSPYHPVDSGDSQY